MPAALPDVLSSDGKYIFMRTQKFDLNGKRLDIGVTDVKKQKGDGMHLFSPTGFLDGSWWHRSYWIYGKSIASGAGAWYNAGKNAPAGRIMVFDDSNVYGFGRRPEYFCWSTPLEYHLFSADKEPAINRLTEPIFDNQIHPVNFRQKKKKKKGKSSTKAQADKKFECLWSENIPILVRAMVLADKILFIAGPPDVVDEEEVLKRPYDPDIQKKLKEQMAANMGEQGALLWAISAQDGNRIAEYKLDSIPIFDGISSANGRLYIVTSSGRIISMGKK